MSTLAHHRARAGRTNTVRLIITLLITAVLVATILVARHIEYRSRQINDWIRVQRIADVAERSRASGRVLPTSEGLAVPLGAGSAQDSRGGRVIYTTVTRPDGLHHLVVALGRDGFADTDWAMAMPDSLPKDPNAKLTAHLSLHGCGFAGDVNYNSLPSNQDRTAVRAAAA